MIPWYVLVALALANGDGHRANAGSLPVCANRTINEVVARVGCTVGDGRCWQRSGGFCTDYVERRLGAKRAVSAAQLVPVRPEDVEAGDVAVFQSRAHYAYVERVLRGRDGRPTAVDLAEYNFGTCWVDKESMVTERYAVVGRRGGVALGQVDGAFLRLPPARRGSR